MTQVTMKPGGDLTLPADLCQRYGLSPDTPLRVIETGAGILLVPLTGDPMSDELRAELAGWQEHSMASWEMFPYEEDTP